MNIKRKFNKNISQRWCFNFKKKSKLPDHFNDLAFFLNKIICIRTSTSSHALNADTPKNKPKVPPIFANNETKSILGASVVSVYDKLS